VPDRAARRRIAPDRLESAKLAGIAALHSAQGGTSAVLNLLNR
jgi:hypothetical protein